MQKKNYKLRILLILITCIAALKTNAQTPVITGFSPSSGPAGTTVTITGNNFNVVPSDNIVFFGAEASPVIASSTTSLTVNAPTGATYQPITVLNTSLGLSAASRLGFVTTFAPNQGAITTSSFDAKVDFTAGLNPWIAVLGDIDGDGKPDVVVANSESGTISIFRNVATSGIIDTNSLAAKVDFPVETASIPQSPESIALVDMDGDGKLDVVVTYYASNTVAILRNTSTSGVIDASSLAAKVDFTTGPQPRYLAVADIDGDGRPDLVTANQGDNTLSLFRNIATSGSITNGSLSARVDFATGNNLNSVSIADIDGDGKPDILATWSDKMSIFRNISTSGVINSGSLAAKVDFGATLSIPVSIGIGDIDGDGKPDILVSNNRTSTISVFRNKSTSGTINASSLDVPATFATGSNPTSVTVGDLDGDGKPDVVVTNENSTTPPDIFVFRNTAVSGSITSASLSASVSFTTGRNPIWSAIGDMDGDGRPEIVVANLNGYSPPCCQYVISILHNDPPINTSDTLATGIINGSPFCPGATLAIPFTSTGTFNAGNVYTAHLSDASGSFSSPAIIGTLSSVANSGIISATIPLLANSGLGYRIRVVSSNPGIIGMDNGSDLAINSLSNAGIISVLRDTLCEGTPGKLTVTGNSGSIQWQQSSTLTGNFIDIPGANDNPYNPLVSQTTNFREYVTNSSCADTSASVKLVVIPSPVSLFTYSTNNMEVTFNSSGSTGAARYNWDFGDSSINNVPNPVHVYTRDDTFYVCLTIYNGSNCSFTYCQYISVGSTGIRPGKSEKLSVYPNPVSNSLLINNGDANVIVEAIEIYDLLGRTMIEEHFDKSGKQIETVNVTSLAEGTYYLKIRTAKENLIYPITKLK